MAMQLGERCGSWNSWAYLRVTLDVAIDKTYGKGQRVADELIGGDYDIAHLSDALREGVIEVDGVVNVENHTEE